MARKRAPLKCISVGVTDTSTGRFYTMDEVNADPELKRYIEKRMNENITKAVNADLEYSDYTE